MDINALWAGGLSLIGVFFGWLLNELTSARAAKREQRKPLGSALSHLLHVHWTLTMAEAFRRQGHAADSELGKKIASQFKVAVSTAIAEPEDFEKSFDRAVEEIAQVSPRLAFELRGKVKVRGLYALLQKSKERDPRPEDELAEVFGDIMLPRVLQDVEEISLQLAKRFGRNEYTNTRHHFQELRFRLEKAAAATSSADK